MNILDHSIEAAGGVSRLAESLDLEPNVISNWRKRGIPVPWAQVLTLRQRLDGNMVTTEHITTVRSS